MQADGSNPARVIFKEGLQVLLDRLKAAGYQVIGPTVREGAIVYRPIDTVAALPAGIVDEQAPGRYRLGEIRVGEQRPLFAHVVGPDSWKRWLHPPQQLMWRAERKKRGIVFVSASAGGQPPRALLGVRACEIAAMRIQDRVLAEGEWPDAGYRERRKGVFIVAVNCGRAGGSCFCASMGMGPEVTEGFDLALTEQVDAESHRFVVTAGSPSGQRFLDALPGRPASEEALRRAREQTAKTAAHMGRDMPAYAGSVLRASLDHSHWEAVAGRCLHCGNCTMVCPTCFCTSMEERTALDGKGTERWRQWDSCFNASFSYLHGGPIRNSGAARYRQWLTHKLAHWEAQFGTAGCSGCGRCVTWCPVGIDITEEVRALGTPQETMRHDGG